MEGVVLVTDFEVPNRGLERADMGAFQSGEVKRCFEGQRGEGEGRDSG